MVVDTLDLRDRALPDMGDAIQTVAAQKTIFPDARYVILSRTQREVLVKSDPVMYAAALKLEQQFEKPMSDLDFVMIIEGCRVIIE